MQAYPDLIAILMQPILWRETTLRAEPLPFQLHTEVSVTLKQVGNDGAIAQTVAGSCGLP